jgi:hypothetical protein
VNSLIEQGLRILHVEDWSATPGQITEQPEWAIERERPFFLLISAAKA